MAKRAMTWHLHRASKKHGERSSEVILTNVVITWGAGTPPTQGVPHTKARRAPLKIYFARLGLRSTFGHAAAQSRPPDQLPPRVERLEMAKWGQGVQESILPSKWDGEYFRKFSTIVGNASPQSTFCVLPTKSARRPSHYTYGTRAWRREWRKRGRCSPVVAL